MPLVMSGVGIPHMLHCQLLHRQVLKSGLQLRWQDCQSYLTNSIQHPAIFAVDYKLSPNLRKRKCVVYKDARLGTYAD